MRGKYGCSVCRRHFRTAALFNRHWAGRACEAVVRQQMLNLRDWMRAQPKKRAA
jgi:hypothetical protein